MSNLNKFNKGMKVSVLVATYNPIWEKLKLTVDSIINQKDIDIELVVADDGSENSCFFELEKHLKDNNFEDYKLVALEHNAGTVKNVLNGLSCCTGEFTKPISPGDYFTTDTMLSRWTKALVESKRRWSIGKAIYYSKDKDGNQVKVKQEKHPALIDVYEKQLDEELRWNYLVLDDIGLGAAVYSETKLFKEYISKIVGKVIFTEDTCYRIMVFDNILPHYFSEDVIYYEVGYGISNSKNAEWQEKILKDFHAADKIMLDNINPDDTFQKKIKKYLKDPNRTMMIKKLFQPGRIRYAIKKRL